MRKTRTSKKTGRKVISSEYAHHLATAPFAPRHFQPPSYLWAGAGIAHPLVGNRVTHGRITDEDSDPYASFEPTDDELLALL